MNTTTACIFPETLPDKELLFPLVQVFETIVHLQTVENESRTEPDSPFIEELRRGKRLQACTPIPLGPQREHFLALAQDIATRGHAYINQLSMLTLADMHLHQSAESRNSIITALLSGNNIRSHKDEEQTLLWQARLILKMAETLDREHRAVDKALQTIDKRQKAILEELREEKDTLFSQPPQSINRQRDGALGYRLRAWSRLFFHHPSSCQPEILVTSHEEAMTSLQDTYEKNQGHACQQVAVLDLPAALCPLPMEQPVAKQLIEGSSKLRAFLRELLVHIYKQPMHHETTLKRDNQNLEQHWQQQCERQFPARDYGRCRLELSVFPGISPRCLFLESFAGEAPKKKPGAPAAWPGTIVGLLRT
jgi:hypothetical protein